MNNIEKNLDDCGRQLISCPDHENEKSSFPIFRENCAEVFFINNEVNIPSVSIFTWVISDGACQRNNAMSPTNIPLSLTTITKWRCENG